MSEMMTRWGCAAILVALFPFPQSPFLEVFSPALHVWGYGTFCEVDACLKPRKRVLQVCVFYCAQ